MRLILTLILAITIGCDSLFDSDSGTVEIIVTSDVDTFSVQNPVALTVVVQNETDDVFTLYPSSSCALSSAVIIEDQNYQIADVRICLDFAVPIDIESGDSYSESWSWDGAYVNGESIIQLEPGSYKIVGLATSSLPSNELNLEYIAENF